MKAITLDDIRAQMSGTAYHAAWSVCLPLVETIACMAEEDPAYAADLAAWLDGTAPNITVHLRDKLCWPLRYLPQIAEIGKQFNPTTEWHNTWMPLDSAAHRARHGILPEEW